MNFATAFRDAADQNRQRVAIIDGTLNVTYREFDEYTARFANALKLFGVGPQERVLIMAQNKAPCLVSAVGCFRANVIACPINTRWSAVEIERAIEATPVSAVAFDSGSIEQGEYLRSILPPDTPFIELDEVMEHHEGMYRLKDLMTRIEPDYTIAAAADGDIAMQLFTSGTTGTPKSVLHSHSGLAIFMSMFCFAATTNLIQETTPTRDTVLALLPLYHISSMMTFYALTSGGKVVLHQGFDMERFLDAIQTHRVTRTTVASTIIEWMLDRPDLDDWDFSSVVYIGYGGSPISRAAVVKAKQALKCTLLQAYGATESLIVTTLSGPDHFTDWSDGDMRSFSAGKPMMGAEVKILDSAGNPCGVNEEGEIWAKSPAMMLGYAGKTREQSGFDENGWLRMGDTGYIDPNGFLFVTGRITDMIISGGENVYPKEVESCIAELDDLVEDVAVIGVPHPKWGETPVAFVVPKPGSSPTEQAIIAHCEQRIAHYKRPSRVMFLDVIPQDGLGKVKKDALKKLLGEA